MSRSCPLSGEGHSLQRPATGVQFGVLQLSLARGTAAQSKGGLTGLDGDKPGSLLTESQQTADFQERCSVGVAICDGVRKCGEAMPRRFGEKWAGNC